MPRKVKSPEEVFSIVNDSLSQYADLAEDQENIPHAIFDDIVTIDERYSHNSPINKGGMKKIYRTHDALTNRPVAKAVLIECEDSVKTESFLREARLTAALEHPNIIPVYDIGVDEEEGPYFIMKLIGGSSLADILKNLSADKEDDSFSLPGNEKKDYSLQNLLEIFLKICDAVAYAHSRGIIHLDLKPDNIQIGEYGEVIVCDWGLAKVMAQPEGIADFSADLDPCEYNDVTLDGIIKGTPGYMAPEQINTELGQKDQTTDIFALGGILYSLLCLKTPFDSETLEGTLQETLAGQLPLPSERAPGLSVPASLEAVAMKAMRAEKSKRYSSVSELKEEIQKWMGGFATEAENASFITSAVLLLKRHKVVSSLLLILLVLGAFGIYEIKENERIAKANEQKALLNEQKAKESQIEAIESEQKAKANEQKALLNEQKALLNEQKAKDALALYKKEKELTDKINKRTLEQLVSISENLLTDYKFDRAIEEINASLKFQPENEKLNSMKGEVHFYRQEYAEALAAFEKVGSYKNKMPFSLMIQLAPQFLPLKDENGLKAVDLVKLLKNFQYKGTHHERIFKYEANKFSYNKYKKMLNDPKELDRLKNHLNLCRLMMLGSEPEHQLNFSYKLEEDGISLDLSNSKWVYNTRYIRHLPLKSFNVENTKFWYQWIFSHHHLKAVNIRKTNIKKMAFNSLVNSGLKEITLSKEQYDNSDIRYLNEKRFINFVIK